MNTEKRKNIVKIRETLNIFSVGSEIVCDVDCFNQLWESKTIEVTVIFDICVSRIFSTERTEASSKMFTR